MIQRDLEFRRISGVPRRHLPPRYSIPGLLPDQEFALGAMVESARRGRCFGALIQMPVGKGKTLPSFWAPAVLDSRRWVLLVMSSLREKTKREWAEYVAQGHNLPPLHLATYDDISRGKHADILTPDLDLIIADEPQELRRMASGRTKRMFEHFKTNPQCRFVGLSANMLSQSVLEVGHLLDWALRDFAPFPRDYYTQQRWAAALDPNVSGALREGAGALLDWPGADVPGDTITRGRAAFARRLAETPGVYICDAPSTNAPLYLHEWPVDVPPAVDTALTELRATWVRPDGHQLLLATEFSLAARTLALGFHHLWEEYPEQWWYDARAEWAKFVADRLRGGARHGLATEGDVAKRYPHAPERLAWERAQAAFKPKSRTVWIDKGVAEQAACWVTSAPGRIAWVKHPDLGAEVAKLAGVKWYGAGPKVGEKLERDRGPAVASWRSHGTGRNLQRFWDALFLESPVKATSIEQLIGRHHRQGQTECVHINFPMHIDEVRAPWDRTLDEAENLAITGRQPQKLFSGVWV